MDLNSLKLVTPNLIPKGEDCPNDSITLWKLGLFMQQICEKELGIGLSAVQLGIPWKFFIIKFPDSYRHFVDCSYSPRGDTKVKGGEGCLSLRNEDNSLKYFEVERFEKITVIGKELLAEPMPHLVDIEWLPDEMFAPIYTIVFQHEIDHALQITIDQIGKELYIWSK